tara:strand:- start:989 stop:1291 length:303 start_codon:yes stop_codon:yes gene_type:complete
MTNFNQKCYELISKIPSGRVVTYKQIANRLNMQAYRAVGNAMANNPNPIIVPCHRVIKSDGSIGGYTLGIKKKINLLINEGIMIKKGRILDFEKYIYSFE